MIRNIVFDMGGVLIAWSPELLLSRLSLSEEDAALLLREVFWETEWVMLDRGSLHEPEAFERVARRLPGRLHAAARHCIFDWWKDPFVPTEGMAALIAELKALGCGVYLLSNATSRLHEYFPRIPGSEHFDGKLVSADRLLLKPQREIYEKLYESFSLRPEECFFVDDNPMNVEAAGRTGMRGAVFFNDIARLRRALREAGVPVSEEEA